MIPLISARQEPQLVPAFNALPMASTLWQPSRMAAVIWFTPTLKQSGDEPNGLGMVAMGQGNAET